MPELRVESWDITRLVPYIRNPRKNDVVVDKMCGAIQEFGFRIPVIARSDGTVIDGHLRLKAAQKLGLREVPVALADELTEAQVKAFRILANRSANWAEWDDELLKLELEELEDMDFDLSLTGLDGEEIEKYKPTEIEDVIEREDEVPEVEEEAVTQDGDVWICGNHRVMCGDSTDPGSVFLLLNGKKQDMVFTDPPYNMEYKGQGFINQNIKNVRKRIKDLVDFQVDSISYLADWKDTSLYFFTSKNLISDYLTLFSDWQSNILFWAKTNSPPMVNNNFLPDVEYLLYFYRGKRVWNNGLPVDTYKKYYISPIEQGKWDGGGDLHPTMKPVEFVRNQIEICSKAKGIVLDLFGGSGTTLIAAQYAGRCGYLMEKEPRYCDVIVRRWQKLTGDKAYRESDNAAFGD